VTFELFAFEQILKPLDVTDDEILAGHVAGGDDGGLDGIYVFLDGNPLRPDSDVFEADFDPSSIKRAVELELVAIQAKGHVGFGETAYEKASAAFEILLDLTRSETDLRAIFSDRVVEQAQLFRAALTKLAPRHPKVRIVFAYATKGETGGIDPKVQARREELEGKLQDLIHGASAEAPVYGSRELLDLHARQRPYALQLRYKENATSADSHVAIVTLGEYFDFITDESGGLRKYIFDWNVRDYEGDVEVNRAIKETLDDPDAPEFWWLNNGVTVLCSTATLSGKTFNLDDVQIVNGLQTSVTLYDHLRSASSDGNVRDRSLLVRIIVTEDSATRDRVIRATNSQTAVPAASLRATDQIQRDLEAFFSQRGWHYERRKNFYKNQGRPPDRIVSIPFLAQAMMAMGFSEPNNSRARPSSLIKSQPDYERLFDSTVGYDIFLFVASLQRRIDEFMKTTRANANSQERTNLRFHLGMLVVAAALGAQVHHPSQLRVMLDRPISDDAIERELARLRAWLAEYQASSHDDPDKIAKSREFVDFVLGKAFPRRNRANAN
jgi:hypothetical protein